MEDQPLEEQLAKITRKSVAIAGSGEAADDTIAALLNDHLPLNLGAVFHPHRMPRHLRALHFTRAWLESEDVLGENGTVDTEDILASLLSMRKGDGTKENPGGDDLELYVLWPAEPDKDELALVRAAFDNDIRVRNLSAMLQDLDPDEVFPPEPEPEPTPAEAAADEAVEALGIEDSVPSGLPRVSDDGLLGSIAAFVTALVYDIARKEGWPIGTATVQAIAETVAAEATAVAEDKPPFDPPFVSAPDGPIGSAEKAPGKLKYFYDPKNDRYRVAKFRPKTGEETVYLDEEEIGSIVRAGLVTD